MSSYTRRELATMLGSCALSGTWRQTGSAGGRRISLTMDDPNLSEGPHLEPFERNESILRTLDRARLRAALFVCGMRVDSKEGKRLLQLWSERGHTLANHTYSHLYYHDEALPPRGYIADIERGEEIVRGYASFRRWFRYPMLKAGNTVDKRDAVRRFLAERRYAIGHVTIDTSDWYVDQRLRDRLTKDPESDTAPYRDFYLRHMWDRATFYDDLSVRLLGRRIPHTLLLHHNLLSALFLPDLLSMFRERGWEWVSPDEAYEDPVFAESPDIIPAGESLVWALAKQTGRHESELRYPGEDGAYEEAEMDRLGL